MIRFNVKVIDAPKLNKEVERIFRAFADFPQRRRERLQSAMRRGIERNFRTLSSGSSIGLPSGGSFAWSRRRARLTWMVRRKAGMGPVTPILMGPRNLLNPRSVSSGSFSANKRGIRYTPPNSIARLLQVHQRGLPPLPDKRGSHANEELRGGVAPRPVVFWSGRMVADVRNEARMAFRDVMREARQRGGR